MTDTHNTSRRRFIRNIALAGGAALTWSLSGSAKTDVFLKKAVPSSGELLPVIGLGSSRTFNVGHDKQSMDKCASVMQHFFEQGGVLVDSSPMYGSSQPVIGYGLNKIKQYDKVFAADKVWISDADDGPEQIEQSRQYWGVKKFDLMQVHNLVAWRMHLQTLQNMKQAGNLRYLGITTSHGRRHQELERIMQQHALDFVQLTYNIEDREVEARLLPIARERGIAIIVNRPFQRGDLIEKLARYPLPKWASEIECKTWAQFLLKYIVSHPAVTVAIPATTRVDHLVENMQAMRGPMPDAELRKRMSDHVEAL